MKDFTTLVNKDYITYDNGNVSIQHNFKTDDFLVDYGNIELTDSLKNHLRNKTTERINKGIKAIEMLEKLNGINEQIKAFKEDALNVFDVDNHEDMHWQIDQLEELDTSDIEREAKNYLVNEIILNQL